MKVKGLAAITWTTWTAYIFAFLLLAAETAFVAQLIPQLVFLGVLVLILFILSIAVAVAGCGVVAALNRGKQAQGGGDTGAADKRMSSSDRALIKVCRIASLAFPATDNCYPLTLLQLTRIGFIASHARTPRLRLRRGRRLALSWAARRGAAERLESPGVPPNRNHN